MTPQAEIILISCIVAIACALPGVFLVLRKMSLMSDAISHSVLLGIIVAFLFTENVSSPWLIIGATITGVLTVSLTELLINTRKVKEDAAIGLVFPFLFSVAVILINKFAGNVHLDTHVVLLGEVAFAPFHRLIVGGVDLGPQALWVMIVVLLVNVLFIALFYKELKLATFDAGLAASLGFAPALIHYGLMTVVSVTAVGAFDVVGSILVVALIVAPPSAAYLLTEKLEHMILISCGIGMLSAITGYGLAHMFDVSIAGSMATMAGVFFVLAYLFAPHNGLIAKVLLKKRQKITFSVHMLLVHLLDHEDTDREKEENSERTLHSHLNWDHTFTKKIISKAKNQGFVGAKEETLFLTMIGRKTARDVMSTS